jgi:hypothetical protein
MIHFDGITIDRGRAIERRSRIDSIACGGQLKFKRIRGRRSYKFRLACALLLAGPKTAHELVAVLYGRKRDGGPLSAYNMTSVRLYWLQRELASIGIQVRHEPLSWPRRYFAQAAPPAAIEYREAAE